MPRKIIDGATFLGVGMALASLVPVVANKVLQWQMNVLIEAYVLYLLFATYTFVFGSE